MHIRSGRNENPCFKSLSLFSTNCFEKSFHHPRRNKVYFKVFMRVSTSHKSFAKNTKDTLDSLSGNHSAINNS